MKKTCQYIAVIFFATAALSAVISSVINIRALFVGGLDIDVIRWQAQFAASAVFAMFFKWLSQ